MSQNIFASEDASLPQHDKARGMLLFYKLADFGAVDFYEIDAGGESGDVYGLLLGSGLLLGVDGLAEEVGDDDFSDGLSGWLDGEGCSGGVGEDGDSGFR